MRRIDFTPVFRSSVGFDRMARLMDAAFRTEPENQPNYPPCNIVSTGEDGYRISMAIAGFSEADVDITVRENSLTVSGKIAEREPAENTQYLHRGLATRAFERHFDLADHIQVTGAGMENGMLHIELVREIPEEKKPRRIAVARAPDKVPAKSTAKSTAKNTAMLEGKAA